MRLLMICLGLGALVFIACVSVTAGGTGPLVVKATEMLELNNLFQNQLEWLGGDGVYSLDISEFHPNTILWVFGDTDWGKIKNGEKVVTDSTNNSLALYNYKDKTIEFFPLNPNPEHNPKLPSKRFNIFKIAEWVKAKMPWGPWPFAPFIQDNKIYCFLMVIDFAGWTNPLGDWIGDIYLAEVDNPKDGVPNWHINYYPISFLPTEYRGHSYLWLATDVLKDGDVYYMYGVRQEQVLTSSGQKILRHFVVARTRSKITDFGTWEFYDGEKWSFTPQIVKDGPSDLSTEYSVIYFLPYNKYLLIYQRDGLQNPILRYSVWGRWSDTPVGPWGEPQLLYKPTDLLNSPFWKEDYRIYAVKAHYPYLSDTENEVVVSYVLTGKEAKSDPRLYHPYFVKITFEAKAHK